MGPSTLKSSKSFQKYFDLYINKDAVVLFEQARSFLQEKKFSDVVVVPLCGEEKTFPRLLESFKKAEKSSPKLIVGVVNESVKTAEDLVQQNQNLLQSFEDYKVSEEIYVQSFENLDLVLLNCTARFKFGKKSGVGLARKIGADFALLLFKENIVEARYCYNTDGDVQVPTDYFCKPEFQNQKIFFSILPFRHTVEEHLEPLIASAGSVIASAAKQSVRSASVIASAAKQSVCSASVIASAAKQSVRSIDNPLYQAAKLYDQHLKLYMQYLREAHSPYAFVTIGSLIVFSWEAYVAVRGFGDVEAGEDFYFLNKIAKVAQRVDLPDTHEPLRVSTRLSLRVPFGTGYGIKKFYEQLQEGQQPQTYSHKSFEYLKILNETAEKISQKTSENFQTQFLAALSCEENRKKTILLFLEHFKFKDVNFNSSSSKTRRKTWYDYFDSFKTMKFIHLMRDEFDGLEVIASEAKQSVPNNRQITSLRS